MCSAGRPRRRASSDLPRLHQLQVIGPRSAKPLRRGPFRFSSCSSRHSRTIAGGDSRRIQDLHHAQCLFHLRCRAPVRFRDLLERRGQTPVLIQIADDVDRGVAHGFGHHQHGQLRLQMVGKSYRGGEKRFKRRLLDGFRRRALIAGIQIIVEERAEVDFVERILVRAGLGCLGRLNYRRSCHTVHECFEGDRFGLIHGHNLRHFARAVCFGGCSIAERIEKGLVRGVGNALVFKQRLDFLGGQFLAPVRRFLQHRVLRDLLNDHVLQLEAIELQDRDHLDQARGQNLLLRDLELQPLRKHLFDSMIPAFRRIVPAFACNSKTDLGGACGAHIVPPARLGVAGQALSLRRVPDPPADEFAGSRRCGSRSLAVRLHAGHPFADDQGVDVIGSLVRFYRFEVAHVPHNRILIHDAVGPEQIAAEAGAIQRDGRVIPLEHGDVGRVGTALVLEAAHLNGEKLGFGDLGDHPGELVLHELV